MTQAAFQIQSTIIVLLMVIGIMLRSDKSKHVPMMSLVIAWDILLVLQIELTRSAIAKASQVTTNPMILNIHVTLATTTIVFYLFMIYYGRKLLKGDLSIKTIHRRMGLATFVLRMATYITSYFVVIR